MVGENENCDIDVASSAGPPPVPRQVEEHGERAERGGRNGSSRGGDGVDASCCDWPPQEYESSVLHVVKEEGDDGDEGEGRGKRPVVVEEKVVLEYEGRRLTLRTLLEEDELAPLFDGAYWPGTMVWPVSLWTAEYIHHTYRKQMDGAKVVELGGVPGMLCHLMGAASVALTEQPELMRIINQNIKENFGVEGRRDGQCEGDRTTHGKEEENEACQEEETPADIPHPASSPTSISPPPSSPSLFASPLWWSREAALDLLEQNGWPAVDFVVCCDCIYAPFWGESYNLLCLLWMMVFLFWMSMSSASTTRSLLACFEEFAARSPSTCTGILSVERRNGDGVDDFLACARATMEVKQVQHDQARGWFVYELRAKCH